MTLKNYNYLIDSNEAISKGLALIQANIQQPINVLIVSSLNRQHVWRDIEIRGPINKIFYIGIRSMTKLSHLTKKSEIESFVEPFNVDNMPFIVIVDDTDNSVPKHDSLTFVGLRKLSRQSLHVITLRLPDEDSKTEYVLKTMLLEDITINDYLVSYSQFYRKFYKYKSALTDAYTKRLFTSINNHKTLLMNGITSDYQFDFNIINRKTVGDLKAFINTHIIQ